MNINATCIIQIINFWITYFVLHKFLLKPFVKLVDTKRKAREQLLESLKEKALKNTYLQNRKKKNLEDFQESLRTRYVFKKVAIQMSPSEVFFNKDPLKIEALIEQQKNMLVKKAPSCMAK